MTPIIDDAQIHKLGSIPDGEVYCGVSPPEGPVLLLIRRPPITFDLNILLGSRKIKVRGICSMLPINQNGEGMGLVGPVMPLFSQVGSNAIFPFRTKPYLRTIRKFEPGSNSMVGLAPKMAISSTSCLIGTLLRTKCQPLAFLPGRNFSCSSADRANDGLIGYQSSPSPKLAMLLLANIFIYFPLNKAFDNHTRAFEVISNCLIRCCMGKVELNNRFFFFESKPSTSALHSFTRSFLCSLTGQCLPMSFDDSFIIISSNFMEMSGNNDRTNAKFTADIFLGASLQERFQDVFMIKISAIPGLHYTILLWLLLYQTLIKISRGYHA